MTVSLSSLPSDLLFAPRAGLMVAFSRIFTVPPVMNFCLSTEIRS